VSHRPVCVQLGHGRCQPELGAFPLPTIATRRTLLGLMQSTTTSFSTPTSGCRETRIRSERRFNRNPERNGTDAEQLGVFEPMAPVDALGQLNGLCRRREVKNTDDAKRLFWRIQWPRCEKLQCRFLQKKKSEEKRRKGVRNERHVLKPLTACFSGRCATALAAWSSLYRRLVAP